MPRRRDQPKGNLFLTLSGHLTAIALAGTAFCYFAGYSYTDQFRSAFGLGFAATQMSTPELTAIGYTIVLVAIFENVAQFFIQLVWQTAIGVVIIVALVIGKRRSWPFARRIINWLETIHDKNPDLPNRLLGLSMLLALLIGAPTAGGFVARSNIQAARARAAMECCFLYKTDSRTVRGTLLLQDTSRLFVLTKGGVSTLPAEGARVVWTGPRKQTPSH